MEQNNNKNFVLKITILVVIIGLISGAVGELLFRTYFLNSSYNLPMLGDINYSDTNSSNLVIREPKKVVVEQNDKVDEIAKAVSSNIVAVIDKNSLDKDIKGYYSLKNSKGQGLIVTSDGWIMTNYAPVAENADSYKNFVVVTKDKKIYSIDSVIDDKVSKFYFLHIKATDLPVRKFADQTQVANGQLVLTVNWEGSSMLSSIVNVKENSELINFSDTFNDHLTLLNNLGKEYGGPAIYNLAGEVVGLIKDDGKIEAIGHLNSAIAGILKERTIKRPSFGVYYANMIDLASAKDNQNDLNLKEKGALIVKNKDGVAVAKGSPADLAGFKEGDIILSVNNIELDNSMNLTDAIEHFGANEKVNIIYVRNGVKKEIGLKLGEAKK